MTIKLYTVPQNTRSQSSARHTEMLLGGFIHTRHAWLNSSVSCGVSCDPLHGAHVTGCSCDSSLHAWWVMWTPHRIIIWNVLLLITWCSGTLFLCVNFEQCSFNDNPERIPMLQVSTHCIGCTNLFEWFRSLMCVFLAYPTKNDYTLQR